jgi:hypothetical protein
VCERNAAGFPSSKKLVEDKGGGLEMAIISPIFGEMRGKLGGNVYSRNIGGPYVRMHAVPTNPNSARQQSTRNWLATCAAAWNGTLTAGQRAQWNEFAETHSALNSLGQTIFLTGLDWYTKVNSRLLDAGLTPIAEPDNLPVPDGLLTMALTLASATSASIAFTPELPSGACIVAWGSGPITAGSDPNFRQHRLIGYSAADQVTPAVFTLPYTINAGVDLKVYVGVMGENGRVSVMLSDRDTGA